MAAESGGSEEGGMADGDSGGGCSRCSVAPDP